MKKMSYAEYKRAVEIACICARNFVIYCGCPTSKEFMGIAQLSMVDVDYPEGITWDNDPVLQSLIAARTTLSAQRNKWLREHGGSDAVRCN